MSHNFARCLWGTHVARQMFLVSPQGTSNLNITENFKLGGKIIWSQLSPCEVRGSVRILLTAPAFRAEAPLRSLDDV
ncbi:hypothetical protein SFRURICE_008137 [Spodoptera frugiperda]|nr:hypothetical protein SFRURICE_008137 [Spodoptera frugiperda]